MGDHRTISIADQIFELLERDILSGKYPRGEVLSELRLSEELGVSRTPVREAIRRLEQENILEDTGRGAVVVGISKEDMQDMYEIRSRIEDMAAARAAKNITDEQLREMKEALDLQRFYIERQEADNIDANSDKIKNLDSKFHEILYKSCGSKALSDALCSLHKKMTKSRKATVRKHSRAVQALQEHLAIYEALAAHDSERSAQAVLEHVANARASLDKTDLK